MSILAKIIERTRADVASRKAATPQLAPTPSDRSFYQALSKPRIGFILEAKKASPSKGLIRPDFDPIEIADAYAPLADAISVLTDAPHFQGSHEYLRLIRDRVSVPVLCKDFIVDPYQVAEARTYGADAVLLMLSVLTDDDYRACHAEADRWAMDVLTEVHTQEEADRAVALGARIVGINNRDLTTLRIDLDVTRQLAPDLRQRCAPGTLLVCESGISTRADVDTAAPFVDAFLVGSALTAQPRIDLAARRLIYGGVKICGIRTIFDARVAFEAGASLGGLIFAPESPRCVSDDAARTIAAEAPLLLVGVFVNESVERVAALAHDLCLVAVQLHGDETPTYVAELRKRLHPSCQIIKAVNVTDHIPHPEEWSADLVLLDAPRHAAGERGGTGATFDWSLLHTCAYKDKVIVAGGITPSNVVAAHRLGAGMLDVNSGVESSPGVKSPELLQELFAALRDRPEGARP